MFGGIITRSARILSLSGDLRTGLQIQVSRDFTDALRIGDSVGINGVCLTLTAQSPQHLHFDVWPESLQRSTLAALRIGQQVHIDLPLQAGEPIGGHPVLGHVDYAGRLLERSQAGDSTQLKLWIELPAAYADLVPERGSVALDGVSLTVTGRRPGAFAVSLIPETLRLTHLESLAVGDRLNVECDFAARQLNDGAGILALSPPHVQPPPPPDPIGLAPAARLFAQGAPLILACRGGYSLVLPPDAAPALLTWALATSRSPCVAALSATIAEDLSIPAPVINARPDEEINRRYLLGISHRDNRDMDCSAPALLRTLSLFSDPKATLKDWKTPGNIFAVQAHTDESADPLGPWEAAVLIAQTAGRPGVAICLALYAADGADYTQAQALALQARCQLAIAELNADNSQLQLR